MTDLGRSVRIYLGVTVAIVLTVLLSLALVRSGPGSEFWGAAPKAGPDIADVTVPARRGRGVTATLSAGDVRVTRTLPVASFALAPGQSLDPRLAAAGDATLEARLAVTFDTGRGGPARIGGQLRDGQLIVRHGGRIVLSEAAGPESAAVLSPAAMPVTLAPGLDTLEVEFTATGSAPALRLLWQPEGALAPLPLTGAGHPLVDDAALRGRIAVERHGCTSCHESRDPARQAMLSAHGAPRLVGVGARVRPSWLRRWIAGPGATRPGTRMPVVLTGADAASEIEDLTHYLVAAGGPIDLEADADDAGLAATGMVAYHRVGCVACHGPLEPPSALASGGGGSDATPPTALRVYEPLGEIAGKTTASRLAAFLADPLATRPHGSMPSLMLDGVEARAIAAYLVERGDPAAAPPSEDASFVVDPARVARGHDLFSDRGCAGCHEMPGAAGVALVSTLDAPPLEMLAGADAADACLGDAPRPGAPWYDVGPAVRADIGAFLASLDDRLCEQVPGEDLAAAVIRFNCTRCHAMDAELGPEAAVQSYFATIGEADLGDEGRLPPDLSAAGTRLTTSWLDAVLSRDERARPYLATRMPVFGTKNVGGLPALLAAAHGATAVLDDAPPFDLAHAAAGRRLVGASAFNCIQCHTIAGHDATGTPGPDLALMPGRLHYEAFGRWVGDPSRIRPGTRMPTFFVGGTSSQIDILGGRADDQIGALWSYLSQGEGLPLPEGLVEPGGYELVVHDEPIVFRTFMKDAGVRAIACGFPEQVHGAFDADRCDVALAWHGRFLSAQGAWGARGGSETNPGAVGWTAPAMPLLRIAGNGGEETRRFRGYRLDGARRPVFRYDLVRDGVRVTVRDAVAPRVAARRAALIRTLRLEGPAGTHVTVHAPAAAGVRILDHDFTAAAGPDTWLVRLGPDGTGEVTVEIAWSIDAAADAADPE